MPIEKFDVLNRFTSAVQFTAEIECKADASPRVKLGLAARWAYKGGAYLRDADLRGADLRDADLGGADLGGADLGAQWVVQGATRSDGYVFLLTNLKDEGVRVKAGCRNLSIAEARKHWRDAREGTPLGNETFAIIDNMLQLAEICGYKLG